MSCGETGEIAPVLWSPREKSPEEGARSAAAAIIVVFCGEQASCVLIARELIARKLGQSTITASRKSKAPRRATSLDSRQRSKVPAASLSISEPATTIPTEIRTTVSLIIVCATTIHLRRGKSCSNPLAASRTSRAGSRWNNRPISAPIITARNAKLEIGEKGSRSRTFSFFVLEI